MSDCSSSHIVDSCNIPDNVGDSVHTEQDLSLSQVHTVRMKHFTFGFV